MARDQVFISYSRKDKDWLERLKTMLVPLAREGFKIWADTDIKPGQEWKQVIEQALTRTKVAVLLVSPDFLASRFIHENELPPLLEAAKDQGLTIIWVPVRPSYYKRTVIANYQAAHPPALPLSRLKFDEQEDALVRITEIIEEALLSTVATSAPPSEKAASVAASPRHSEVPVTPPPRSLPAIQNIYGWTTQQVQALQQQTALVLKVSVEFHDTFKDGSPGPVMLVIPAGEFLMGSPEDEVERRNSEGPQHKVVIAKPFAMGRYTVTFEEYDRFCEATQREKPSDANWGRGRRPVINVSWADAVAYCAWLSQETGAAYRLPSEAEWEYAARVGSTTAFWWGDDIDTTRANYDGNFTYRNGPKGEYRQRTVPVDTFQPNPFGLYQVHGNVWEWVQDSWHDSYEGAPGNGLAWVEEGGGPCVLRGGSWHDDPLWVRGAARLRRLPHTRSHTRGFRLARTFP